MESQRPPLSSHMLLLALGLVIGAFGLLVVVLGIFRDRWGMQLIGSLVAFEGAIMVTYGLSDHLVERRGEA